MTRQRTGIVIALWLIAFGAALSIDRAVTNWVGRAPLFDPRYNSPWKWPRRIGEFQYIIPVILLVGIFHPKRWRAVTLLGIASCLAGATYSILKWAVGRARPNLRLGPFSFDVFKGGIKGIVTSGNLAFPSGHTTFAFAVAGGLAILFPRWRWGFYALASMCGVQRVLEYAHHPSDVVASAALGILAAHLANMICKGWLKEGGDGSPDFPVVNPRVTSPPNE